MKYIGGLSLLLIHIGLFLFHMNILAILSLVFLKLIVSGHMTIFVTRTKKAFWIVKLSKLLFIVLISTMIVGYIMTAFEHGVAAIGNIVALFVVSYVFIRFLVEDWLRLLYDIFTRVKLPKIENKAHEKI